VAVNEPEPASPGDRSRVLIVDDNEDAAESLNILLESFELDVRVAHSGPEALAIFAAFQPAFVLLDIGMPGMDGYEVARAIRSGVGPQPVIVAVTGWGQEADRQRAREAGFDHHLVKPVDLDELQAIISARPAR
jgi:CheY-like chemotaxis protein